METNLIALFLSHSVFATCVPGRHCATASSCSVHFQLHFECTIVCYFVWVRVSRVAGKRKLSPLTGDASSLTPDRRTPSALECRQTYVLSGEYLSRQTPNEQNEFQFKTEDEKKVCILVFWARSSDFWASANVTELPFSKRTRMAHGLSGRRRKRK